MNYKKFGIVMFEIINLVLLTFSFSFLVSLNLGVVVAEDINDLESNCCLEATNGAFCQEFVNTECAASCNGGCQPTSCSEVATCQLGCCQDGSEGTCGLNSLKGGCEEGGGNWFDSISCDNVAECDDGCCLLGNQAQFTTETRCARLSADMGVEVQYDAGITTEIGCLASAASLLEGACILPSGDCRYLTEQECYSSDSSIFYVGVLCSNPLINSTCERQSYTGCAEGMDEVFWFDSCGNRENVYSSDKDASWNNGNMLIKSESCGYGLTNINNPDCGNCNYLIGSRCENYAEAGGVQPTEGEYICKDMNCHNAPDNSGGVVEKSNGESWCVYDGSIGDGDDLVGSRHWKYVCVDGETESEPCSDFRNEICSQGGSDGFSQATCRTNKWSVCSSSNNEESEMVGYHDGEYEVVNYNEEENEIDEDTKMEDCDYKHIFLSSEMEFDLWLPKYAPGFDVVDNYGSAEEICAQANMECTVIYVKEMGSWECVANCECEEESFSQNMNEWCSSLGDCGFKMNIAGDEDAAYSVENTPAAASVQGSLDWEGNYVEPGDTGDLVGGAEGMVGVSGAWGEILLSYADENYEGVSSSPPDEEGGRGITGEVVGGGEGRITGHDVVFVDEVVDEALTLGGGAELSAVPIDFAQMGAGIVAGILGGMFGSWLAGEIGLDETGSFLMSMGFGMVASSLALQYVIGLKLMTNPITFWIGVALIIISLFFGGGDDDYEEILVTFTCNVWEPPSGSENCHLCNEDANKECSKYRCQSLGAGCEFINEGSDNPLCDKTENDGISPKISPWYEALDSSVYEYRDVTGGGMRVADSSGADGCVQAFTYVMFGVQTDEPAHCKFDYGYVPGFDEMKYSFGTSSSYDYNHTNLMMMPSVDSIADQFNVTRQNVTENYGNLEMYVKCSDRHGNYNHDDFLIEMCISPEPDRTAPIIQGVSPRSPIYLGYGENSTSFSVFTNEPSECRWSFDDVGYDEMTNNMNCQYDLFDTTILGYKCSDEVSDISSGTIVYVKCKDRPYANNESERNANTDSYEIEFRTSTSALNISSSSPSGMIVTGERSNAVAISITTVGGAEAGKSFCEYDFESLGFISFVNTGGTTHSQQFTAIPARNYTIPVKCHDVADNEATGNIEFGFDVDVSAPWVVRVFKRGGLVVMTNEDSECAYSHDNCLFVWENATEMSGTGTEHEAEWLTDETYYVLCRDSFGNVASDCSIVVQPVSNAYG